MINKTEADLILEILKLSPFLIVLLSFTAGGLIVYFLIVRSIIPVSNLTLTLKNHKSSLERCEQDYKILNKSFIRIERELNLSHEENKKELARLRAIIEGNSKCK